VRTGTTLPRSSDVAIVAGEQASAELAIGERAIAPRSDAVEFAPADVGERDPAEFAIATAARERRCGCISPAPRKRRSEVACATSENYG
jgi:hypothetical protein